MTWDSGNGYVVTTDLAKLDMNVAVELLEGAYWSFKRSRETIEASFRSPAVVPFVVLDRASNTVGVARCVTDKSTFTWVADVIIHPDHRKRGLGKFLMKCITEHPELKDIRMILATRDAQPLYEPFGFERIEAMRRRGRDSTSPGETPSAR